MIKRTYKIFGILAVGALSLLFSGCSVDDLDELGQVDPVVIQYDIPTPTNATMILDTRSGSYYVLDPNKEPPSGGGTSDSYRAKKMPEHGELLVLGSIVRYTPDTDFTGIDKAEVERKSKDGFDDEVYKIKYVVDFQPEKNVPPVIKGTPPTRIGFGKSYLFIPTAHDGNGDTLTFSIVNKPDWATFNTTTGELSGTSPFDEKSYDGIIISVSDGKSSASLPPFNIVVNDTNRPPKFDTNKVPSTVVVLGEEYYFEPLANDPDGDTLTFSIANKPNWATFDTTTGVLQGTPTDANLSDTTTAPITISVFDNKGGSDALPVFTITIQ